MEGLEASRSTESRSYDFSRLEPQSGHATRGARRDFNCSKKRGVFSCAAEFGNERVLTYLIDSSKFEVDSKDMDGRTPLWWASKSGREAAVKLLVSIEEVDVNSKEKQGIMPLLIAAEKGHDVVARLLIEGGADVHAQG